MGNNYNFPDARERKVEKIQQRERYKCIGLFTNEIITNVCK